MSDEETDLPRIRPDRGESELMCVTDGWAVWRTSELIEETRHHRGQRFIHRFYRQRLSEPLASFAFRFVSGPGFGRGMTIDSDGTIVFVDRYTVKWCDPDGTIRSSDPVRDGMICRVYVDGVVVQAGSRVVNDGKEIEAAPASFIPIKGRSLDFAHEVEIAPAGVKSLSYGEPIRHGNVLAWMASKRLHLFNVQTGVASIMPADDKNETEFNLRNTRVIAFDGETVLAGSGVVIDANTGKRIASNWDDKRIISLFATRSRIGYRLKDGQLEAVDIMHPSRPPMHLADVPHPLVFQSEAGLLIWTGAKWKTVPWLSSFPEQSAGD